MVHDQRSTVSGYLLTLGTASQRLKLDDFEGGTYSPVAMDVTTFDQHGKAQQEVIDADVYVWNGERQALTSDSWEIEAFVKDRLEDWLDLSEEEELVGKEKE